MEYRLPCHPSVTSLDPLGIADWAGEGDPPAWLVVSQLLGKEPPAEAAGLCELLSTVSYSLHQTDPDLSTLRVLLEDHPGAARQLLGALPGMCQHALRMPQLFPADVLPVLQAGQNGEVELSRTQVACLLVHMFFGTLSLPPWSQWWSGFSVWYGAQGEPPKAYLRCLIHFFALTFGGPPAGLYGSEESADAAASGAASQRDVGGGSEDCGADPALKLGPGLHPSAREAAGHSVSQGLTASGAVVFCRRVLQQEPDWAASTQLLLPARVTGAGGRQLQCCAFCRQHERAAAGSPGVPDRPQQRASAPEEPCLVEAVLASPGPQQHAAPSSPEAVRQHQPLAGVSPREALCERQLLGLDGAATGRRQQHIASPSKEPVCQHQPLAGVAAGEALCERQLLGLDGAATGRRQHQHITPSSLEGVCQQGPPKSTGEALRERQLLGLDGAAAVVFANREVSFGPAGTQEEQVFGACPELCVAVLLCPPMGNTEALLVQGAAVLGRLEGYGPATRWARPLCISHHEGFTQERLSAAGLCGCSGASDSDPSAADAASGAIGATNAAGHGRQSALTEQVRQEVGSGWDDRLLLFMDAAELDAAPQGAPPSRPAAAAAAGTTGASSHAGGVEGCTSTYDASGHAVYEQEAGEHIHEGDAPSTAPQPKPHAPEEGSLPVPLPSNDGNSCPSGSYTLLAPSELSDPALMRRELGKAYCTFAAAAAIDGSIGCVATGHWGCGAFGGDRQAKALLQLMAASQASLTLLFQDVDAVNAAPTALDGPNRHLSEGIDKCTCSFGAAFERLCTCLAQQGLTVGELHCALESFGADSTVRLPGQVDHSAPHPLFQWVHDNTLSEHR